MRALDARGIAYEVLTFTPAIHSAVGLAHELGVAPEEVYKTLVLQRSAGKPFLVMIAGDATLDLKRVAKSIGEKRVRMAPHRAAESITGLRVGGISSLALLDRGFSVLIDRSVLNQTQVYVSAGKRGLNLRVGVPDLIRVTGAQLIDAAR
jgi:Cys-tRNA(Pro)/Cys-tRNA(Cys) deacylase